MKARIDQHVARFLLDVAEAVGEIKSGKLSYGEFYVSEVVIGFDGEDSHYRVLANEHGEYDIAEVVQ